MEDKIKVGVDIVDISRIEKILSKRKDRFLKKVFTKGEREYISRKGYKASTVAGIFSAKEAVSKVLGSGIGYINWHDIEVVHDEKGRPYINMKVKLREKIGELGIKNLDLSISHEKDYALAFALGLLHEGHKKVSIPSCITGLLVQRKNKSHKGSYGRVGVISGSRGMTGAPYLSTQGALRTGSGLVYTMIPKSLEIIMSMKLTEAIIKPIEDMGKGHFTRESLPYLLKEIQNLDALAIGPGMGMDKDRLYIVEEIIKNYKKPIVLDADAINCLSIDSKVLLDRDSPIVMTPHPGELSRFLNKEVDEIQKNRISYSKHASKKYKIALILKGDETVVTSPTGNVYVNTTGNPGMATAGSGDVLTGIILSLLGQGMEVGDAGKLGVFAHGLAGDMAKETMGEYGLIASDILDKIPLSLKEIYKED